MAQMARMQRLSAAWRNAPQDVPAQAIADSLPAFQNLVTSADQVGDIPPAQALVESAGA
jgi:hypothetical protein